MGKNCPILYTDSSLNLAAGCCGCELYSRDTSKNHCYAATLCRRYAGRKGWPEDFNKIAYFPERLSKALRWSDLTGTDRPDKPWLNGQPRVIFVNDLGDGFCPSAEPNKWLYPYLHEMILSPHVWLLLTKWPGRMLEAFNRWLAPQDMPNNFWFGTTVTSAKTLWRLGALMKIPGNLWLSLEPLTGPVSLDYGSGVCHCGEYVSNHQFESHSVVEMDDSYLRALKFVALGGESGSNARPMHPDWARAIRDECEVADIPFMMKQHGEWVDYHNASGSTRLKIDSGKWDDGFAHGRRFYKVGKHAAGRKLDGIHHNGMPDFRFRDEPKQTGMIGLMFNGMG